MYNLLLNLLKPFLNKNKILKNKYYGEDVYIFGNGLSLKNYDFNMFKEKNILSCGYFFINKYFKDLNICAHIEIDPFILYHLQRHKFTKKIQKNYNREIYLNNFPINDVPLITSVTNLLAFSSFNNIFFAHHFGTSNKKIDIRLIDISNKIMYMRGSMYFLIALSMYMGFKKVYLVGMDYINIVPENGHFYEYGNGSEFRLADEVKKYNQDFFNLFNDYLDISVINKKNKKAAYNLNNIYYEDFFNTKEKYAENIDICEKEGLITLHKLSQQYIHYTKKIYPNTKIY